MNENSETRPSQFGKGRHTFVLRLWTETREIKGAAPVWRGVIENVMTGDKRYFQELEELCAFLVPYLEEMGAELKKGGLRRYLKRLSGSKG